MVPVRYIPRSFSTNGTPRNGPLPSPRLICASAWSKKRWQSAFNFGFKSSTRSRTAVNNSRGVTCFFSISSANPRPSYLGYSAAKPDGIADPQAEGLACIIAPQAARSAGTVWFTSWRPTPALDHFGRTTSAANKRRQLRLCRQDQHEDFRTGAANRLGFRQQFEQEL